MRGTTRNMSDAHEVALVEALGGRRTRGSGNQANNPMDGRHNRYTDDLAFAWDGKSTLGKSISITLEMIEKARDQALAERPMIALRWYATERLAVAEDWVAITLDDFQELLHEARQAAAMRAFLKASKSEIDFEEWRS
jgi:hypothetical protein